MILQARWATAILALLALAPAVGGDEPQELDATLSPKVYDTHFARYGYSPGKAILREPLGFRFRLPAKEKGVEQTGVYSYFTLAGDFELSATFELIEATPPQTGYGVTCGIAIDTEGPDGAVVLSRGFQIKNPDGYFVVKGSGADWAQQKTEPFPTKAVKGTLGFKREKKELICLVGDGPRAELAEFHRMPFSTATIRKVRLFADSGGASSALDVRLGSLKVQAEEITGGLPAREKTGGWSWWLLAAVSLVGAAGGYELYRYRQSGRWLWWQGEGEA